MAKRLGWQDRSDLLLPPLPALYRVRNRSGTIIYIGKTTTFLENRFGLGHREIAAWWEEAVQVEVRFTGHGELHAAEAAEIHRYHPAHNHTCVLCAPARAGHPLYRVWTRLTREHPDRLHAPWHDPSTFYADVDELIGTCPTGKVFRLIRPDGLIEPGNICWGGPGTWRHPDAQAG